MTGRIGARHVFAKPRKKAASGIQPIEINERWTVAYWTTAMGCNEAELREAIAAVGNLRKDVAEWLRAKHDAG